MCPTQENACCKVFSKLGTVKMDAFFFLNETRKRYSRFFFLAYQKLDFSI